MKNISKQLDKLYLEQERELEQAEFTLDAVRNESPIFTVCENQTLSEFLQGEKLLHIDPRMPNTNGGFYFNQYFTNGKMIQHEFKDDGVVGCKFLKEMNQTIIERLCSIQVNIETAIELQKQIEPLEVEECI